MQQPCSRDMQGISSPGQIEQLHQPQAQAQPQIQNHSQPPMHHFDSAPHDDFLDQMLSSCSWPSDSNAPSPFLFDDSALLASKLRHHQITSSKMLLHNHLLAADYDGSSFKSPNQGGGDDSVQALYNGFAGSLHPPNPSQHFPNPQGVGSMQQQSYGPPTNQASAASGGGATTPAQAQPRQRVRARRGQATDPHSIAERLRRERIAERMKALQELVPNANKTDKASMLDEIIDYVKFLQLQVKVLSMSRLGGAAAVAPLVSDISSEGRGGGDSVHETGNQQAAASDTLTVTEQQVAKLMEEDMGSAMQYLQGKGLCLMPISLATAISSSTCPSRNPIVPNPSHLLASAAADGPSSPSMSVLTVQSATVGNGAAAPNAKDAASVSKL